jgi:hypothetical protein
MDKRVEDEIARINAKRRENGIGPLGKIGIQEVRKLILEETEESEKPDPSFLKSFSFPKIHFSGKESKAVPRTKEHYVSLNKAQRQLDFEWTKNFFGFKDLSLEEAFRGLQEILTGMSSIISSNPSSILKMKGELYPEVIIKDTKVLTLEKERTQHRETIINQGVKGIIWRDEESTFNPKVIGTEIEQQIQKISGPQIPKEKVLDFINFVLQLIAEQIVTNFKASYRISSPVNKLRNKTNARRRINRYAKTTTQSPPSTEKSQNKLKLTKRATKRVPKRDSKLNGSK